MKVQDSNSYETWNEITENSESIFMKFFEVEQTVKIPYSFYSILPKIKLSKDKFQFESTCSKEISKIPFKVMNCNDRPITIKLQPKSVFYFEGDPTIKSL